ncbi:tripartite motif-containing protein 2-like [Saccostrea echinata]|uniref:tripartite motif-containing protein 2-like n=1 Tax=Saccostrea echinata TaxID=191078 RepID=UPI002A81EAC7|nr:tripartite motif-containing protein 2-like [Saccostrea echinata]
MATAMGQDVIQCQLCPSPVEHHCNICHINLCLSCIPKHLADKSRKHEIVEYKSKRENISFSSCSSHNRNRCLTYCQECKIPICSQCVIGSHKNHDFTNIIDFLQKRKQEIIADTEEMENTIFPKYRNANPISTAAEFEKLLCAIEHRKERICKSVHETCNNLKDKVTNMKKEEILKCNKNLSLTEKAVKELNQVIQSNKAILRGNDASAIMKYEPINKHYLQGLEFSEFSWPYFFPGIIKEDQIVYLFGLYQTVNNLRKKPGMLKMMDEPVVVLKGQTIYGNDDELMSIRCSGIDNLIISGNDGVIREVDKKGSQLKKILTHHDVWGLAINLQQEMVFSFSPYSSKNIDIYMFDKGKIKILLSIPHWFPVGLCYTENEHLLVSMRSEDKTQSIVARYSGTAEIQKIQYGSQGQALFSTDVLNGLQLTENGDGNICVADNAGNAVIAVDSSGILRFKYIGDSSKQLKNQEFKPCHIDHDVNNQILISDISKNNIVHILDCNGNFVRYIEYPCDGGLSIDRNHNLVIGDRRKGKLNFIKYLEC